jgi:broad specificity phosphatase PhoE
MRHTLLVRHGQASARARDYDVLSPLGIQQAQRLGRHLATAKAPLDAVFAGPRKRQRDSAQHLVASAREHHLPLPDPVELPGADEIPLDAILMLYLPRVIDRDPAARAIAERNWDHPGREIHRVLVAAMQAWAAGEVSSPSLLTFDGFVRGIDETLAHIRAQSAAALLVTSAGPVATALHLAAHDQCATPSDVMRTAMSIENASVTRIAHDGARLAATAIRDVTHLAPHERTFI